MKSQPPISRPATGHVLPWRGVPNSPAEAVLVFRRVERPVTPMTNDPVSEATPLAA